MKTFKCPVCNSTMKNLYPHWVNPLHQCKNRSCSESQYLRREDTLTKEKKRA